MIHNHNFVLITSKLDDLKLECGHKLFKHLFEGQTVTSSRFRELGISKDTQQGLVSSSILSDLDGKFTFESQCVPRATLQAPPVLGICPEAEKQEYVGQKTTQVVSFL